jgi:hypothetical protein
MALQWWRPIGAGSTAPSLMRRRRDRGAGDVAILRNTRGACVKP